MIVGRTLDTKVVLDNILLINGADSTKDTSMQIRASLVNKSPSPKWRTLRKIKLGDSTEKREHSDSVISHVIVAYGVVRVNDIAYYVRINRGWQSESLVFVPTALEKTG